MIKYTKNNVILHWGCLGMEPESSGPYNSISHPVPCLIAERSAHQLMLLGGDWSPPHPTASPMANLSASWICVHWVAFLCSCGTQCRLLDWSFSYAACSIRLYSQPNTAGVEYMADTDFQWVSAFVNSMHLAFYISCILRGNLGWKSRKQVNLFNKGIQPRTRNNCSWASKTQIAFWQQQQLAVHGVMPGRAIPREGMSSPGAATRRH